MVIDRLRKISSRHAYFQLNGCVNHIFPNLSVDLALEAHHSYISVSYIEVKRGDRLKLLLVSTRPTCKICDFWTSLGSAPNNEHDRVYGER